jgi:hypothetical protein
LRRRFSEEFKAAQDVLRQAFEGVSSISTAQTIAVLLMLSESVSEALEHPHFPIEPRLKDELGLAISAHILGSRSCLSATYLSGVISGPIDADQLDYMARDSHSTGLATALDVGRIIANLDVVTITPENAFNVEVKSLAEESPGRRIYALGISVRGLDSYEQMILAKVLLRERLYNHPTVRAANEMVRRLLLVAEEDARRPLTLSDLFAIGSDDSLLLSLAGEIKTDVTISAGPRSTMIGKVLLKGRIYEPAFAFAPRFIAGLDHLPHNEQPGEVALLWTTVLLTLESDQAVGAFLAEICGIARKLQECIPIFGDTTPVLDDEVIIECYYSGGPTWGADILTIGEDSRARPANLYFNTARWAEAYELQKLCGFVFAPRERVPLVALAARIAFFNAFQITQTAAAEETAATTGKVPFEWIEAALKAGICSRECFAVLTGNRVVQPRDIRLPPRFLADCPDLADQLAKQMRVRLPSGLPPTAHLAALNAFGLLIAFLDIADESGWFASLTSLSLEDFQLRLTDHLRSCELAFQSALDRSESDFAEVVLPGPVFVGLKVLTRATTHPLRESPSERMSRRCASARGNRVAFEVIAYRPPDQDHVLRPAERIAVMPGRDIVDEFAHIVLAVPWGYLSGLRRPADAALGGSGAAHLQPISSGRIDLDALLTGLESIPVGNEGAAAYHEFMFRVLPLIFQSGLRRPEKELEMHEGRKRVDIVFSVNSGDKGFFYDLVFLYGVTCPFVFVECKNYSADPANPELDQLTGRFSKRRGEFGFSVCRTIEDKGAVRRNLQ